MMVRMMKSLVMEEQGQGMTEYGLVLGLIAVAVVTTLALLRQEIITIFQTAYNTVLNRNNPTP